MFLFRFHLYMYKCHVTTIIFFEVFLVWLKSSCLSINSLFNCDFFVISFMVFSEEPIITVLFVLRLFLVYYCNAKGLQYFLTSFYSLIFKGCVFSIKTHRNSYNFIISYKCSFQFKLKLYNTFNMHIRCALLNLDKNKAYQIKT